MAGEIFYDGMSVIETDEEAVIVVDGISITETEAAAPPAGGGVKPPSGLFLSGMGS